MGKELSIRLKRLLLVAVLCLSLWSCGLVNPQPPRAVVAEAVTQKVAQTQAVLQRQLALPEAEIPASQVSGIKITAHHWTTLTNQPVVEVEGIYRLKGGGLTWAQQRQARDFSLYLKRGESQDQWIVVEPTP